MSKAKRNRLCWWEHGPCLKVSKKKFNRVKAVHDKFVDLYEAVPATTAGKAGQKTTTPAAAKKKKSTAVQKAGFRLKKAGAYCSPTRNKFIGRYNTVEACFNACKAKAAS